MKSKDLSLVVQTTEQGIQVGPSFSISRGEVDPDIMGGGWDRRVSSFHVLNGLPACAKSVCYLLKTACRDMTGEK